MAAPTGPRKRGKIIPRRASPGEASAAPLIERGYVDVSSSGSRAVFVWHVTGLSGPEDLRLATAIQVVGIPRYGDWHPVLNVPVSNVRADPVKGSTTQAYVTVEYGLVVEGGGGWFDNEPSETAAAQMEVVSTVQGATTEIHQAGPKAGQQILVSHIVEDEEAGTSTVIEQGGEVAYEMPMHMVIFRRRENFSPGIAVPGGRFGSVEYVSHTNRLQWLGDAPGIWLCTKMNGYSDDNGVTWNVTYEFQRRLPNWDATAWYRDPATGAPIALPDDTSPDTAIEVATVQNSWQADFRQLRLFG